MDITSFVKNFANQFDETDPDLITADTHFKDLDEWSSLTALSIIAMADEEYEVTLSGKDIHDSTRIIDIYEIIKSRV